MMKKLIAILPLLFCMTFTAMAEVVTTWLSDAVVRANKPASSSS